MDVTACEAVSKLDRPRNRPVVPQPADPTLWEADPFYEAAEAVQEELDHLNTTIVQLRELHASPVTSNDDTEQVEMTKRDALTQCESIEAQVEDFEQVIRMCKMHPERFHLSAKEVARRKEFVSNIADEVSAVRREVGGMVMAHTRGDNAEASRGSEAGAAPAEATADAETKPNVVKPAGVLIGEVGKLPTWEVVRQEEERKRKEREDIEAANSYLNAQPKEKTFQEKLRFRLKKFWQENDDSRLMAPIVLIGLGVFGLHTFYGVESLV